MNISESEGADLWLQVLTDLQNHGQEEILIACTDNLKGFTNAILSVSKNVGTTLYRSSCNKLSQIYCVQKPEGIYEGS